jgi:hypothetical protein
MANSVRYRPSVAVRQVIRPWTFAIPAEGGKMRPSWRTQAKKLGRRIQGLDRFNEFVAVYNLTSPIRAYLKPLGLSERALCKGKLSRGTIKTELQDASHALIATRYPTRVRMSNTSTRKTTNGIEIFSPSLGNWRSMEAEDVHGIATLKDSVWVSSKGERRRMIGILCSRTAGMGRALMQRMLELARDLSLTRLDLIALRESILFYRKFGFVNSKSASCDEDPSISELARKVGSYDKKLDDIYNADDFADDLLRRDLAISRSDFPMFLCLPQ